MFNKDYKLFFEEPHDLLEQDLAQQQYEVKDAQEAEGLISGRILELESHFDRRRYGRRPRRVSGLRGSVMTRWGLRK